MMSTVCEHIYFTVSKMYDSRTAAMKKELHTALSFFLMTNISLLAYTLIYILVSKCFKLHFTERKYLESEQQFSKVAIWHLI